MKSKKRIYKGGTVLLGETLRRVVAKKKAAGENLEDDQKRQVISNVMAELEEQLCRKYLSETRTFIINSMMDLWPNPSEDGRWKGALRWAGLASASMITDEEAERDVRARLPDAIKRASAGFRPRGLGNSLCTGSYVEFDNCIGKVINSKKVTK
mgnify:CR=1 FL=1